MKKIEEEPTNPGDFDLLVMICEGLPLGLTILEGVVGECSVAEADCRFHKKVGKGNVVSQCNKRAHIRTSSLIASTV